MGKFNKTQTGSDSLRNQNGIYIIDSSEIATAEDHISAQEANLKHGLDKATEIIEQTAEVAGENAGKDLRATLQQQAINQVRSSVVQHETSAVKEFLANDIPALAEALSGKSINANQARLSQSNSQIIDAEIVDDWDAITLALPPIAGGAIASSESSSPLDNLLADIPSENKQIAGVDKNLSNSTSVKKPGKFSGK